MLVDAVTQGLVEESRIDESAQRVLTQKFALGLFDNPFVDEAQVAALVGTATNQALAADTQRQSLVLLENRDTLLPLDPSARKVWLHGVSPSAAVAAGFIVVETLEDAELAIIRSATPYEVLHPDYVFGAMQHEGRLDFTEDNPDYQAIVAAAAQVPTIVSVTMDRPAILTKVREHATAILANFGLSDAALLDVIAGRAAPQGKLPFALPADMQSVDAQLPDVAFDLDTALYPFGFGLSYGD